MSQLDSAALSLAIALTHALPTGSVEIDFDDGTSLRAGRSDEHALSPCALRAMAIMNGWPRGRHGLAQPTRIDIGGPGVTDLGGGIYRCTTEGVTQWWIATRLAPQTAGALLEACPCNVPEAVDASLRPDGDLGVTILVLSAGDASTDALDQGAQHAATAFYVEALIQSIQFA